jgi:hypothetical protein
VAIAKVLKPMNPLFIDGVLPPPFPEDWMALHRSTPLAPLTGENPELARGFRLFLDNQARKSQLKVRTGPDPGLDIGIRAIVEVTL